MKRKGVGKIILVSNGIYLLNSTNRYETLFHARLFI